MAAGTIVLTGSAELNRKLATLAGPKAKAAIRKASREALRPVAAAAKANAPRRSGALSKSIKVRAMARSRTRIGSRVTTSAGSNEFSGKTYYGGFQEYGWKSGRRTRNADLGMDPTRWARRTAAQKAQAKARDAARKSNPGVAFLKRAAVDKREIALRIYRTELGRQIVMLAGKS